MYAAFDLKHSHSVTMTVEGKESLELRDRELQAELRSAKKREDQLEERLKETKQALQESKKR